LFICHAESDRQSTATTGLQRLLLLLLLPPSPPLLLLLQKFADCAMNEHGRFGAAADKPHDDVDVDDDVIVGCRSTLLQFSDQLIVGSPNTHTDARSTTRDWGRTPDVGRRAPNATPVNPVAGDKTVLQSMVRRLDRRVHGNRIESRSGFHRPPPPTASSQSIGRLTDEQSEPTPRTCCHGPGDDRSASVFSTSSSCCVRAARRHSAGANKSPRC
jgi:hypothetical protein